jgi:phytoene desaturase
VKFTPLAEENIMVISENWSLKMGKNDVVIIIGGGLSGLSTGCYLRMNDFRTFIFEHGSGPGGLSASWKEGEYLFDTGIHYVMGIKGGNPVYRIYEELGIFKYSNVYLMRRLMGLHDESRDKRIEINSNMKALEADLKRTSSEDPKEIDKILSGIKAFQSVSPDMIIPNPSELAQTGSSLAQLWSVKGAAIYLTGKYTQSINDYTESYSDPWLKFILRNIVSPDLPMWYVFLVMGMLMNGQLGYLDKGSRHLASAVEQRYIQLGGKIEYASPVEKIMVDNNKAVGVKLENGKEYRGHVVISTIDTYTTFYQLLGKNYVTPDIEDRFSNWKLYKPVVLVNLGANHLFKSEPPLYVVKTSRPIILGDDIIDTLKIRFFNYSREFAPAGRSVFQVSFDTSWDYWNKIHMKGRAIYEPEKKKIIDQVLERIEIDFPGLRNHIEASNVATPSTVWKFTRNHKGSPKGFILNSDNISKSISRKVPGLENFYMAGQWLMPGGGVPRALASGRHAAQILCREQRIPFKTLHSGIIKRTA